MPMPYRYWSSHYVHDGATKCQNVDLRHEPRAGYRQESAPTDSASTYPLLMSCRTIYAEVAAIVYSTNKFHMCYEGKGSLRKLYDLRPGSIQTLRHLTLHLNATTCFFKPCERARRPWNLENLDQDTDQSKTRHVKAPFRLPKNATAIDEWHRLWREHLEPNLSGSCRLDFSLVCDVADYDTGKLVVQPLLEVSGPWLAKCRIRLSAHKDPALQRLAQQAVEALVAPDQLLPNDVHDSEHARFRFMDLPAELRQHVLQYTDLVTRRNEVEWNPKHRLYYCRPPLISFRKDTEVPISLYGADNMVKNQGCWRPEHVSSWFCWEQSWDHGCFCTSYHSAYSNVVRCRCWAPPTPLFLVCKLMRQDAIQVFFSRNRFNIAPESIELDRVGVIDASPLRLPASIFLSDIVPRGGLRHLRSLDIYFPAFGDEHEVLYCAPGSPEHRHWISTLDSVKHELTLSKLTVRVSFGIHPSIHPSGWGAYRRDMTEEQKQRQKECYLNTTAPLKAWRGMDRFFAHFPDPQVSCWWEGEGDDMIDTALERRVGKMVMGDEYEMPRKEELGESLLTQWDNLMYGES